MINKKQKAVNCLLGGAAGDALGNHIEFHSIKTIRRIYGENGIQSFKNDGSEEITDDTQMTLFTTEGLIEMKRQDTDSIIPILLAYHRWVTTQKRYLNVQKGSIYEKIERKKIKTILKYGTLINRKALHVARAPGNTCLSALGKGKYYTIHNNENDSKGCGGVMRAAPAGLAYDHPLKSFIIGCKLAVLSHGNPTGYISAGAFATIINLLIKDIDLMKAINITINILKGKVKNIPTEYRDDYLELINMGAEETINAIQMAVSVYKNVNIEPSPETIEHYLGGGWIGEEALAIALYSALVHNNDFKKAICLSVNHSGDSDSTGSICGNIMGINNNIPDEFNDVEEANTITEMAIMLVE